MHRASVVVLQHRASPPVAKARSCRRHAPIGMSPIEAASLPAAFGNAGVHHQLHSGAGASWRPSRRAQCAAARRAVPGHHLPCWTAPERAWVATAAADVDEVVLGARPRLSRHHVPTRAPCPRGATCGERRIPGWGSQRCLGCGASRTDGLTARRPAERAGKDPRTGQLRDRAVIRDIWPMPARAGKDLWFSHFFFIYKKIGSDGCLWITASTGKNPVATRAWPSFALCSSSVCRLGKT
ncbi:hypothetical protein BOBR111200_16135 [Bordetella bronchialis]